MLNEVVEESNEMLRDVVRVVNREVGEKRVKWIEKRHLLSENMREDHVHLSEAGYRVWDGVLWPYVAGVSGIEDGQGNATAEERR